MQKNGGHKVKAFDDSAEDIIQKLLAFQGQKTSKCHMATTHRDFVKECLQLNQIKILRIESKENSVNIVTKPLPGPAHINLRNKILNQNSFS